jgi:NAD(P)-dependent dehydrogenase (short-subunit alcohol dehydrogenase family)
MADGRVALVTAGASGIGRVIAESLAGAGIAVHICDIDEAAIADCSAANAGFTASRADVSRVDQVDALFADLARHHGRLDILVNNAGISGPTASVEDIDPADWDRTIAVDLSGAFYVTRRAVPLLRAARGSIVNIASNAALFGVPLRSPYAASKWALIGLTKTWAMELGPAGVRVNAICPGSVKGARIDGVIERDAALRGMAPAAIRDVYLRQSSMRVFAEAEDIAAMVRYLCSDAAKSISGQSIAIDGHTENLSNWLD